MRTLIYHLRQSNERNTLGEMCDGCRSLSLDLVDVRGESLCPDCRSLRDDCSAELIDDLREITELSDLMGDLE